MRRLRTQTLIGEYQHIDIEDPAIDRKVKGWKESYERAMEVGDVALVPLKNGGSDPPTIWRFRHLSGRQKSWLGDRHQFGWGPRETMNAALQLGLVGVSNVVDEAGEPFGFEREPQPEMRGWDGVPEEALNFLTDGDIELIIRLGVRVMKDDYPRKG